jgi:hypothetical protein
VTGERRTLAFGSPYRWTAATLNRGIGRNWLSLGSAGWKRKEACLAGGSTGFSAGRGGDQLPRP